VFVVGALAVLIRAELNLERTGLGLAISLFWAASALSAVPLGRLAQRISPAFLIPLSSLGLGSALLGLALSHTVLEISLWMVLAGVCGAAMQLAIARLLTESIPVARQGLAFGIKQAAVPMGTMLAGIGVAIAASTLGWRWTTAIIGLVILTSAPIFRVWAGRLKTTNHIRKPFRPKNRLALALLGLIGACGGFSGTSMATFTVDYLVERQLTLVNAGLALALGSVLTVLLRIALGHFVDTTEVRSAGLMAWMMLFGGVGLAAFAIPGAPAVISMFVVLGYGLAWSWPGLLLVTTAHWFPTEMAAAAGVVQGSVWAGATMGPFLTALSVSHAGFPLTWVFLGGVLFTGAFLALTLSRLPIPVRDKIQQTSQEKS